MKPQRAPGYWSTRLLLVAAIVATAATVVASLWFALDGPHFGPRSSVLGVPKHVVQAAFAIGLAVLGLARVIVVFRGPSDEPPPWRYRDR